ncbi:MAG: hypothetical protein VB957_15830 [Pseudomonadales bacterium]
MISKPVWIDKFEELEVSAFPFRISNLLVSIFFSLIFSCMLAVYRFSGLAGVVWVIPLAYVSSLFYLSYLFIIVDFTAQGYQKVPIMSGTLFTTGKSRFFKELLLISFFF